MAVTYDVNDPYTYLNRCGEQRTSRLHKWEDFQELTENYRPAHNSRVADHEHL